MKFSVVITTYNYAHYIYRCVSSVTNQQHQESEIIIVDDGSTDDTKNIILKLQQEYPNHLIKYIWQENTGVSSSRNRGIEESNGEYIWFLDADDYLTKDSIQVMDHHISHYLNIDMIFGGYTAIYQDRIVEKYPSQLSLSKYNNFKNFIKRNFRGITIGATIIKKSYLLQYKFPEHIHVGEDYVVFAKILGASDHCFSIQEIIVNKSRDSQTSLRNDHSKGALSQINCVAALFDDPNIDSKHSKHRNYFISTKYLPASRSYYHTGEYRKSITCYTTALSKYPLAVFRTKYLKIFINSLFKVVKSKLTASSKVTSL